MVDRDGKWPTSANLPLRPYARPPFGGRRARVHAVGLVSAEHHRHLAAPGLRRFPLYDLSQEPRDNARSRHFEETERSEVTHDPEVARLELEVGRRKTFAIISHPDAGKTTLTEKLLLYGGVIQLAGAVKAKRGRAAAVSDWMEMERERGISITTSVLQFPYRGLQMNLLDTPGHADFSEDTYRTLHAVDGAVMLLDCAKGVEAQTNKLFRVCKQRQIPIFTFVNKMDRPGRDAFELIGEVESVLGIGVYPITWPIFRGGTFRGVYHRIEHQVYLFEAIDASSSAAMGAEKPPVKTTGLDDPMLEKELEAEGYKQLRDEAELLDAAGDAFDRARFERG